MSSVNVSGRLELNLFIDAQVERLRLAGTTTCLGWAQSSKQHLSASQKRRP